MPRRPLRVIVAALAYLSFPFVSPVALVAAPLALLLLFQRPGGRERLLAGVLLLFVVWSVTSAGPGYGLLEAAWVCLFAGAVAVTLLWRPPWRRTELLATGLIAVTIAAAVGGLLVAATTLSLDEVRWLAERHFGWQFRRVAALMASAGSPSSETMAFYEAMRLSLSATAQAIGIVLPALVLLQSLAALAGAWALYRMVARQPEGPPLPALREFRFNDHLIWGIVLALLVLVAPGLGAWRLLGGNLATFFGGLYVARGLGVVAALAAAGGVGGVGVGIVAFIVTVLLWPIVAATALALGVSDTWIDWRRMAANRGR